MCYFQAVPRYAIIMTLKANLEILKIWRKYNDFNESNYINIIEKIRIKII